MMNKLKLASWNLCLGLAKKKITLLTRYVKKTLTFVVYKNVK